MRIQKIPFRAVIVVDGVLVGSSESRLVEVVKDSVEYMEDNLAGRLTAYKVEVDCSKMMGMWSNP